MEENKNYLEPTEVLTYNEIMGEMCMNDPENYWEDKIEDGIGDPEEGAEG